MFHVERLGITPYLEAWELQKELVKKVDEQGVSNHFLLLEHPPTITLGRGSKTEHLLFSVDEYKEKGIHVVSIDRGGDVTYHGPGQLVGYPIFLVVKESPHTYLRKLEETLIHTLAYFGISATRKEAYTGVWVENQKIGAIGVKFNRSRRLKGYITSHGFALNVNTDLRHFGLIVPCGIQEYGVTSMEQLLGMKVDMDEVQKKLLCSMKEVFFRC